MINGEETFERFGYHPRDMLPQSNKKIVVICEMCGESREIPMYAYRKLCRSCAHKGKIIPAAQRLKMSESAKGTPKSDEHIRHMSEAATGRKATDLTRKKTSESGKGRIFSDSHRRKIGVAHRGKIVNIASRIRASCTKQGISYDGWEGFAVDSPYCPKFNEACRESNREKYDRRCFLSDMTEDENGQKLSVHHIDMNKAQGCEGHAWKLVPLSKKLHSGSHSATWTARIIYLLEHVWNQSDILTKGA